MALGLRGYPAALGSGSCEPSDSKDSSRNTRTWGHVMGRAEHEPGTGVQAAGVLGTRRSPLPKQAQVGRLKQAALEEAQGPFTLHRVSWSWRSRHLLIPLSSPQALTVTR